MSRNCNFAQPSCPQSFKAPSFKVGRTSNQLKGANTMRRTMQWFPKALAIAISGGLLASLPLTPASAQQRHRVVIIQRVPVVDPFFYPYSAYPPNYIEANYGYV